MVEKVIDIFKAQHVLTIPVNDLQINIVTEIRDFNIRKDAMKLFDSQAKKLAEALHSSLPGGTFDALLVELLDRARSALTSTHK